MLIPFLISSRDRLQTLETMVEWAKMIPNVRVVIGDNESSYTPLLDYLSDLESHPEKGIEVVRFGSNCGPRGVFRIPLNGARFFVVTDPDLDMSGVPLDVIDVCREQLLRDETLVKVGCALSLDGLDPSHVAVGREAEYWDISRRQLMSAGGRMIEAYSAPIDTTFAVYHADRAADHYGPALRLAGEYACQHRPWHYTPNNLPADERYYLDHLAPAGLFYSPRLKAELSS